MRAFFLTEQRTEPARGAETIDAGVLEKNGVFYRRLPLEPAGYQPALDELRQHRGYVTQDEVALRPDTPNLEGVLQKFDPEHHHEDDEVRFVLEGEGVFDVRSLDERWMRIIVEPGDLLVVPKGKHHRFELTDKKTIRCVRLFKDPAGWVAVYRHPQG
jgi:1,2-dihydroxy-3-keto-5-methylthiopentene dioxygenase